MTTRRQRSTGVPLATVAVLIGLAGAGCGRSGSAASPNPSASGSAKASATSSVAAAGSFGSASKVCAPGPATGGGGRGINGKTIRIGVMGDPGNTFDPGLGQEFFDVADAFAKWCNAAGGINGRTVVIDKLDAKLFNVAAKVIDACQSDFMLVGGGNGADLAGVKPRLACKLGQIPAYTVSPQATAAGLQVTPVALTPQKYPIGAFRLLANAYPASKAGLGIAGSNLASLAPAGLQAKQAWENLGYKVSAEQPRPALVANFRPWIEQFKTSGTKADYEGTATSIVPIFTAMNDVSFKPEFVVFGQPIYSADTVKAAASVGTFPPSYVYLSNLPWELSDQYPVLAQAKSIMTASSRNAKYDSFTALGFNAWVLWAQSATACGNNLTQACVLQKAGSYPAYDAGGLFAPVNTNPAAHDVSDCTLLLRLTSTGWVYDKAVTEPNHGAYNCDPRNLTAVKSFETAGG
ncbi:MAG TPA: ABC transporter substrate-binding protein [Frankiaceae bacterium]|nr:ABC transporter substrate-binding protein [Frankiaceae bacterium]